MNPVALISLYGVENNGVRLLSSMLRRNGIPAHLVFFKRWVNNDIRPPSDKEYDLLVSLVKDLGAGVVGVSFTSPFFGVARELTRRIRQRVAAPVVWGGIHATVAARACLDDCDIVCRGEGELAMVDLVRALDRGETPAGIDNIGYRLNGSVSLRPLRPLIQDLDALPFQDYGGDNKFFIEDGLERGDPLGKSAELRIFASRGCPFSCSYCYNSIFRESYAGQRYHRIKKVDTVVEEIVSALARLKRIRKIKFEDDTFIFPGEWIEEFCAKYAASVRLPFEVMFNAECPSQDMFGRLKAAGLRRVQVGLQTGSPERASQVYERPAHLGRVRNLADRLHALRLNVAYDVIVDNPLVPYAEQAGTAEFLLSLPRPFDLSLYSLTVFPGTALCEMMLRKGLLTDSQIEGKNHKSFEQFRFSFSYPRGKDELFIACILSLTSKSFVPRRLVRSLMRSRFLWRHPQILRFFAETCNAMKLAGVLVRMLVRGEAGWWKRAEYASRKKTLVQ